MRPAGFRLLLALATPGLGLASESATAQEPRLQLDLTASRIRYDTLSTLDAPAVAGLMEWETPSILGRVGGGVTGFRDSGWSVQGRGDVAGWFAPRGAASRLRVELSGAGAASRHSSGFETLLARGDARAHLTGRTLGAYGGLGFGVAKSSFDAEAVEAVLPTLGIWGQMGSIRATAQYLYSLVGEATYPELSVIAVTSRGPVDVTAYAGLRRSSNTSPAFDDDWLGASVAYWLNGRTAVMVSGGRYSSDVLQGLPGGDFFSIGVRLTQRRDRPIPPMVAAPIVYSAAAAREDGIVLTVSDARTVEIAGDWNGWQPVALDRVTNDTWRVPSGLAPGVYRFNLRVDGERWIVPEGVPAVDGGYGDQVGLLIISDDR